MQAATGTTERITAVQLREAEQGLLRLLHKKRFPREWIERHVPDVMAQAQVDLAARLAAGREDDTVNLLVVIAYRRALKVLRAQTTGPSTTSIEAVFHLADESTPTPEQETIAHDREERVLRALSHLPERERKLLAYVYYEGMSIRAAGRRVGWAKSAADHHHKAALERLEAMLDRSLLAPELAIPAFIAARHHDSGLEALFFWADGAAESIREAAVLGSGRFGPLAETGNAAAMSGVGRTAAGVCGAAVVACLAGAATGVVGPGVGALDLGASSPTRSPRPPQRAQEASSEAPVDRKQPAAPKQVPGSPAPGRRQRTQSPGLDLRRASAPPVVRPAPMDRERPSGAEVRAPAATAPQTVTEFGVESGEVRPSSPSASEPVPAPAPSPPDPPPVLRPPAGSSGGGSSSSSSGAKPSGSQGSGEFEM